MTLNSKDNRMIYVYREKMFILLILLPIVTSELCEQYPYYVCQNNSLSCPSDKKCIFIEHCPVILSLMNRNELPVHRLRHTVCGYDQLRIKICCNINDYSKESAYIDQNKYSSQSHPNHKCGQSLAQNIDSVGSYPFVARIGFINTLTNKLKYSCNGVIVNERTILTTATCALAKSEKYKLYSVLIGEYNTESDPDCNKLFCGHKIRSHDVSYIIKHPDYDAASFSNNIALLRLKKAIDFTATVQPICFLPEDKYINLGSTCIIVGWGNLSNQKVEPTIQQSLQLKLLSKQQCSGYLSQGLSVELCAIGSRQLCSGYSGSPMLYKYADTYFLVGILSYGSSCDSNAIFPSTFVNVQKHLRWIIENI